MRELFLKIKSKREKNPITAAAIIVAVILLFAALLEILLLGAGKGGKAIDAEDYLYRGNYAPGEGYTFENGKTELIFKGDSMALSSVNLTLAPLDGDQKLITVTVSGKSSEHTNKTVTYGKVTLTTGNSCTLPVSPAEGPLVITFKFEGMAEGDQLRISSLTFNGPSAGGFSFIRWAVLSAVIMLAWLLLDPAIRHTPYGENAAGRVSAKALTVLLCTAIAMSFAASFGADSKEIAYPLEKSANVYNPYVQQFDAFEKGQLHIDFKPSDKLLALENPYDPAQRSGVSYLWDRAFYNGQYYIYFGPAPVYTVYYPYYWATGALPSDFFVLSVFLLLTAVFFPLSVFKFADHYLKRVPFLPVCLAAIGGFFATNALLLYRGKASFYYIATMAGIGFFSLFIYLFMCAMGEVKKSVPEAKGATRVLFFTKKYVLLALAGAAYGGIFASRLSIAVLAAFIVVPALIRHILMKKRERAWCAHLLDMGGELLALGVPVLCIMGAVMAFNAARFGSPFEFGTSYQLTVSNVSKNRLRIGDLGAAIYHYFFQPLGSVPSFPYVGLSHLTLYYGHYVYVDPSFGLYSIPLLATTALAPLWLWDKKLSRYLKLQGACIVAGLLAVAWMDFCLGGVIFRYVCDLTAPAALLGAASLLLLCDRVADPGVSDRARRATYTGVTLVLLATCILCVLLALTTSTHLFPYDSTVLGF